MDDQNRKRKDDVNSSCLQEELNKDLKIVQEADGNEHKLTAAINRYVETGSLSKCRKKNKRKSSKKKKNSKKRTLMINQAGAADQSTQTDFDLYAPFTWASGHPFSLQDVPHNLSLHLTVARNEGMAAMLLKNGNSFYDFTKGLDPQGRPPSIGEVPHSSFPHFFPSQASSKSGQEGVSLKSPATSKVPQLSLSKADVPQMIHPELPPSTACIDPLMKYSIPPWGGSCDFACDDPIPDNWYDELSSEEDSAQFSSQVFLNAAQVSKQQSCAEELMDKKSVLSSDDEWTYFKGQAPPFDARETKQPNCVSGHEDKSNELTTLKGGAPFAAQQPVCVSEREDKWNGLTPFKSEAPFGAHETEQPNCTHEVKGGGKRTTSLQGETSVDVDVSKQNNCTIKLKDEVKGTTNFQSAALFDAEINKQQNHTKEINDVEEATTSNGESSPDGEVSKQDSTNELKDEVNILTNVKDSVPDDAQVSKKRNCSSERKEELNELTNELVDGVIELTSFKDKTPIDAQVPKELNCSSEWMNELKELTVSNGRTILNNSQKNSNTIKQLAIHRLLISESHRSSLEKTCERKISVEGLCSLISHFNPYDTETIKVDTSQPDFKDPSRSDCLCPVQSEPSSGGSESKKSLITEMTYSSLLGNKISSIIPLSLLKKSHGKDSSSEKSLGTLDDSAVDVLSPPLNLQQLLVQQSAALKALSCEKVSFPHVLRAPQNIIGSNAPVILNCADNTMIPVALESQSKSELPVNTCTTTAHYPVNTCTTTLHYPSNTMLEPPTETANCLCRPVVKYSAKENPHCELKKEILEDILKKIPEAGSSPLGSRFMLKAKKKKLFVNAASKISSPKSVERIPSISDIKMDLILKVPCQSVEMHKNSPTTKANSTFFLAENALSFQKPKTAENEFNCGVHASCVTASIDQDELQKIKLASYILPLDPNKSQVLTTLKFFSKKPALK